MAITAVQTSAQQVLLYRNDGTRVKLHISELDSITWKDDSWADPTGEPNRLPMKVLGTIDEGEKAQRNGMHKLHIGTDNASGEKTMLWQESEEISLLQNATSGTTNNLFTLSDGADTRQGCFSGTAAALSGSIALYPYRKAMSLADSEVKDVVLPTIQHATVGGYDPKAALMMGQANEANEQNARELRIGFKNICSYLAFTPEHDLSQIIVTSIDPDDALSGNVTMSFANGIPSWSIKPGGGSNKVTLQGPLEAGQTYYIAVLPGTLKKGFYIASFNADGRILTQQYQGSASFARSKYHNCTSFTQGEGEAYVVDMGLKNGARYWSSHNIGASSASNPGDYFAWGEVAAVNSYGTNRAGQSELKDCCNWANYKYGDGQEHTQYINTFVEKYGGSINPETFEQGGDDGKRELEGIDDAATTLWGSNWKMPTRNDFDQLLTYCKQEYIENYHNSGINGFVFYHCDYNEQRGFVADGTVDVTATEDGQKEVTHIFFPFGGYHDKQGLIDFNTDRSYYWTSTVSDFYNNVHYKTFSTAYSLGVFKDESRMEAVLTSTTLRYWGLNIRPVYNGIPADDIIQPVYPEPTGEGGGEEATHGPGGIR